MRSSFRQSQSRGILEFVRQARADLETSSETDFPLRSTHRAAYNFACMSDKLAQASSSGTNNKLSFMGAT